MTPDIWPVCAPSLLPSTHRKKETAAWIQYWDIWMEGDKYNDGKGVKVEFGRGKYEQNTINIYQKIIT